MTEQGKLKEICSKILYEDTPIWGMLCGRECFYKRYPFEDDEIPMIVDVREIIFCENFMKKLLKFQDKKVAIDFWEQHFHDIWEELQLHLGNPVEYLYSIICK